MMSRQARFQALVDEYTWDKDLLNDPFTYPQLMIAGRELGYVGGEPGEKRGQLVGEHERQDTGGAIAPA